STHRNRVPLSLQIGSHFPSRHFDESGPLHADGFAAVGNALFGHKLPSLILGAPGYARVRVVKGREVKPLTQHKHERAEFSPATDRGFVVAAGARIHIGRRDAVEIARESQWAG